MASYLYSDWYLCMHVMCRSDLLLPLPSRLGHLQHIFDFGRTRRHVVVILKFPTIWLRFLCEVDFNRTSPMCIRGARVRFFSSDFVVRCLLAFHALFFPLALCRLLPPLLYRPVVALVS